jgi:hypothetical protein
MRRPTPNSALFNLFKVGSAALVLTTALACGDSTSPKVDADGVIRIKVNSVGMDVPDSVKDRLSAEASVSAARMAPVGLMANLVAAPGFASAALGASSCGSGGAFLGYTKSKVEFAPEAIPNIAPFPVKDESFIPDTYVPLGFNFVFHGNTYDRVNVYSNGFVLFGPVPSQTKYFSSALRVAVTSDPRNIIALAWTDWDPGLVPDPIRFETRGTAPNRRFILQFNNVPEYNSASRVGAISPNAGRLMSQLVLTEGTNDITIYTNSLVVKNSSHTVTQAIEDATGLQASYDSVLNVVTGVTSARNRLFFNLENDAVRFSPISSKDEEKPVIPEVVNLTANNDPGLASAIVAVAPPAATDNCSPVKVNGLRSDGKELTDPYPVGVTTINWTATDDAGNVASAAQTVTVLDVEAPVWAVSAESVIQVNATSLAGAIVTFDAIPVTDNVGVTSRSCQPESGHIFPIGSNTVTCIASDAAGNADTTAFSVRVIGAHEQIGVLMETITSLELPDGTSQPLLNQLKAAYEGTADGGPSCKKVADFLSMVQKKGSNLSSEEVAALTAEANRILGVMGCPPPSRATVTLSSSLQRSVPRP